MVCGNGKMVELLYWTKNKRGSEMKWMLVMLETWHLLKDYLHIFLKKYEHVVVRHLFSKFLSKSNIDSNQLHKMVEKPLLHYMSEICCSQRKCGTVFESPRSRCVT